MKRKLAAVLSALLLLGMLAGCGGNTASSGNARTGYASAGNAYYASAGNAYYASAGDPRK
ncbi:MAG: hypothetical protein IKD63_03760 [Oscillospiraceae bacterium]|nr:hypothetical protein [Oscillospiraceae bacterium]